MELKIISTETIKPSHSPNDLPRDLCFFDQLTPTTYPGVLLFYSNNDPNFDVTNSLTNLKNSLSQTLTIFYPFSGKIKENQHIDEFDTGVLYIEARANLTVADYLSGLNENMESLNKLLPQKPFCKETNTSQTLISFKVSVFSCNGIAIGTSICHKLSDGTALSHFLNSWSAIFSNAPHRIILPNNSDSAVLFPPSKKVPSNTLSLTDQLWFMKSNYVTRRFFFSKNALDRLKALAKSEKVQIPSRNESVSCFIWKHVMTASWKVSSRQKTSLAVHAVNFRPRLKSRSNMLESCTGNLFWWAAVASNTEAGDENELSHLVALTREVMSDFNEEYLETMVGPDGSEPVMEYLNQLEAMLSVDSEKPDILAFTNWKGFFNDVDFGWGKPLWVAAHGKVGDEFRNLIILVDKHGSEKEVEAFVTLEEKLMTVLERDQNFLAFAASPAEAPILSDPIISSRL